MQKSVQAQYFVTLLELRESLISKGAGRRIRTDDLLITNLQVYAIGAPIHARWVPIGLIWLAEEVTIAAVCPAGVIDSTS
jgi:hypothetical protein